MSALDHLRLREVKLSPSQEWTAQAEGWTFLRLDRGASYWLGAPGPRALSGGEMIVTPPKTAGIIRASQLNEVVFQAFCFDPQMLWGILTLAERRLFETEGDTPLRRIWFLPSSHPVADRFRDLAARGERTDGFIHRAEALGIVAALFDEPLSPQPVSSQPRDATAQRFHQLVVKMPEAELIHQSPAELARLCGCSPRHLNRLFRKHFNTSLRARQVELRLLKARQLLDETDLRIAHIASEIGCHNLSLFNALFKRRFGQTPSECRRALKETPAPTQV